MEDEANEYLNSCLVAVLVEEEFCQDIRLAVNARECSTLVS